MDADFFASFRLHRDCNLIFRQLDQTTTILYNDLVSASTNDRGLLIRWAYLVSESTTIRRKQFHLTALFQPQRVSTVNPGFPVGELGRNDELHGICTTERYTFLRTCLCCFIKLVLVMSPPRMDLWVSIFREIFLRWAEIAKEPVQNPDAWACTFNIRSSGLKLLLYATHLRNQPTILSQSRPPKFCRRRRATPLYRNIVAYG